MTRLEYKGVEVYQTPDEIVNIRKVVSDIRDIPGELAEVGVYQGATALIIRETIKDKELYLFDTFEGFADQLDESDSKNYKVGTCAADIKYVTELMKDNKNVFITKGIFPETASIIKDKKFSFVHIDVDIYQATKDALIFFLPRMSKGGSILIHDYPAHRGVKKAVDELKLTIETLTGRQGIIKI